MNELNEKLIRKYLCYKFTEAELMAFGRNLARANQEYESMEERKKQITKDLASQLEQKRGEVLLYSRYMNNGHEYRDIECRVIFDYPEPGYKTTWRLDTGEMLEAERMSPEERQLKFKFDEANKKDEPEQAAPPPVATAVSEEQQPEHPVEEIASEPVPEESTAKEAPSTGSLASAREMSGGTTSESKLNRSNARKQLADA